VFIMVGELAVSFCERQPGQACVCLDLWSYPDGTYNLVIENFCDDGDQELAFPCAFHHLAGVLNRKPLVSESEVGTVTVERCGEDVCAEFQPSGDRNGFRQCISIGEYRRAIDALEAHALRYFA